MDKANSQEIERFFATVGSRIYTAAEGAIEEYSMQSLIDSGVVVGLSGGADSVVLLLFLLEYRRRTGKDFSILASHINHCIRGEEADRDEAFCKELCSRLGIELYVDRYDIPLMARQYGSSIEEAARMVRYSVFDSIIRGRNDIGCVAVAHNMSDSVETVVFNVLRGSGSRGASGIPPIRDNIIRPLIRVSKKDIENAVGEFGISFVTDSTNLLDDYTRNYIRHEIIPAFGRICSDPERMLMRFADNLRSDDDFISDVADKFIASHTAVKNSDLLALHYSVYVRVITKMAAKCDASISFRIASDIHALLHKDNFSYSLIGRASFVCERGECRVSRDTDGDFDFCFQLRDGVNDLSPLNAVFILSKDKNSQSYLNVYKNSIQVSLRSAIIKGSLYLRSKKDGDTVFYDGMTHKVKKLFSDLKIPRSKRRLIPVLCDDVGVVWVPGFGVRDDGGAANSDGGPFVTLAINDSADSDGNVRLYSASEFRT